MITKALAKTLINRRCPHLVQIMTNEKTLFDFYVKLIENKKNPEDFMGNEEESDGENFEPSDELSPYEYFRTVPLALPDAINKYKEIYENDLISIFIKDNEDLQEISRLSRRFFALLFKNVKRADTVDGSLNGREISDQFQIEYNTKKYMNDPSVDVILEGQVTVDDLRARYDALIKEKDGYTLVEVKGSGNIFKNANASYQNLKDDFLYDLGFQYEVYKRANLPLNRLAFLHINKNFMRSAKQYELTDDELKNFFVLSETIDLDDKLCSFKEYLDNKYYLLDSKGKPNGRMDIDDVIDELISINNHKGVINSKCHYECRKGKGGCPLIKECFPSFSNEHILKLTCNGSAGGYHGKSRKLIEEDGILSLKDIPENYLNDAYPRKKVKKSSGLMARSCARMQVDFAKGNLSHKHIIETKGLIDIVNRDYKDKIMLFFDFESYQYALPLTYPCHPWEQICCQYSMHVVYPNYNLTKHDFANGVGGKITHYEYLGDPINDKFVSPDKALIKTLKEQLEKENIDYHSNNYVVVVYNKAFEKGRLEEMANRYSDIEDYKEFCLIFRNHVVDLYDFFTHGYWYHEDFGPSLSLKTTQPVLMKDPKILDWYKDCPFDLAKTLNYHDGLIQNGGIALSVYQTLLRTTQQGNMDKYNIPYDELRKGLLAYCKIDSWGTVILYDTIIKALNKIKDGTIDLDYDNRDQII